MHLPKKLISILLAINFTLIGCASQAVSKPPIKKAPTPPPTGLSTRGTTSKPWMFDVGAGKYITALNKAGVQVVQLGDNLRIIVPTDLCFDQGDSNLGEQCEPILGNVAGLLGSYGNPPITITGYSDDVTDPAVGQPLSHNRANSVAAYLWAHGMPFKQMTVTGQGADDNIATNGTVVGSLLNRRVEIVTRVNNS